MAVQPISDQFVRWLRQVAPYVHAFRGRTFVIGFGGELFTERQRFLSFVHDLNLRVLSSKLRNFVEPQAWTVDLYNVYMEKNA